ncbi:hypothetical protein BGX26_008288 [Mortierella sp. AD094]|nr:hypothetical protein BGX26_008288 [Mortierella sp. AD094]
MSVATLPPLSLLASSLSPSPVVPVDHSYWANCPAVRPNYDLAFFGLPLEILQYIASFLPFHDLVKVFKSLPRIHRPVFQQQLDHSLALMMLTLEIKQIHGKSLHPMAVSYTAATVLQTRWRATSFDLEGMRVEFQLEEKLGLEMAERRRQELALNPTSEKQGAGSQVTSEADGSSIQHCSFQENIENIIWKSRRRRISATRRAAAGFAMTPADESDMDFPDSNYFHCNRSSSSPILASATVSFEAHRNVPAPWIAQRVERLGLRAIAPPRIPNASSALTLTTDSSRTQSARERIAAFQQNRVLLRSLAKMKGRQESGQARFLPAIVSLDTRDLGQKRVKAVITRSSFSNPQEDVQESNLLSSSMATTKAEEPPTMVRRRHSWHMLGDMAGSLSSVSREREQGESGLSTVFRRFLKRSSWSSAGSTRPSTFPSSTLESTGGEDAVHPQKGSRSADWTSIISGVANSMSLSFRRNSQLNPSDGACNAPSALNNKEGARMVVKTYNAKFNNQFHEHNHEKSSKEGCAEVAFCNGQDSKELFELTYDVRHEYLLSTKLEGERVIRPIHFACSLDFFIQDV